MGSVGDCFAELMAGGIGPGRVAAQAISDILEGRATERTKRKRFDPSRVRLEYSDPRLVKCEGVQHFRVPVLVLRLLPGQRHQHPPAGGHLQARSG